MGMRYNPKSIILTVFVVTLTFIVINDHLLSTPSGSGSSSSISKLIGRSVVVKVRQEIGAKEGILIEDESQFAFTAVEDSPRLPFVTTTNGRPPSPPTTTTLPPPPTTTHLGNEVKAPAANTSTDTLVAIGTLAPAVPMEKRENKCEECSTACPHCEKERVKFHSTYTNYCSQKHKPDLRDGKPWCDCWPKGLVGYEKPAFDIPTMGQLRSKLKTNTFQGNWYPSDCTARQRVAIIVPCRDREEHLRIFLNRINTVLQRQQISYQIFVIEQVSPELFNKAAMMNIAYIQARQQEKFDCYFFHDVDMIPENDHNMYTCLYEMPRHVGSYLDKFGYKVIFPKNFGGVTGFTEEQFVKVNGFSNMFYGWGGEDDDMYYRIHKSGMWIDRYPSTIGRYSMVKHRHDERNPLNRNRLDIMYTARKEVSYKNDGLNSLKYTMIAMVNKPLFKLIYASVPAPVPKKH